MNIIHPRTDEHTNKRTNKHLKFQYVSVRYKGVVFCITNIIINIHLAFVHAYIIYNKLVFYIIIIISKKTFIIII